MYTSQKWLTTWVEVHIRDINIHLALVCSIYLEYALGSANSCASNHVATS